MRILYDIAFFIFSIFYLPVFFIKGKWNKDSLSRLGILPEGVQKKLQGRTVLWVHAVSVGEIGLAVGFVNRLRDELKETQVLITTTTVTGYEVAQKIKNEEDLLLYFPVDFRFAVRSFVRKVLPSAVVLFETEIWPNLIQELSARKVPMVLLNGRISDKAFERYRRVRPFLKGILNLLTVIGAQDERMRERFMALGADPERLQITGNLKFDWMPLQNTTESVQQLKRFCRRSGEFLLVAGSTHEGEEEKLFDVYLQLKERHPDLRLLVAARHLHRVPEIERLAAKKGIGSRKISSGTLAADALPASREVWLLDQMGVLGALYELADAAFVGGSLVPVGGHNLVEPAYFEKAILFGPFMQNFKVMSEEFKQNNAAAQVSGADELKEKLRSLIEEEPRRALLGRAAKRLVLRHQGATKKSIELLMAHWEPRIERKLVSA